MQPLAADKKKESFRQASDPYYLHRAPLGPDLDKRMFALEIFRRLGRFQVPGKIADTRGTECPFHVFTSSLPHGARRISVRKGPGIHHNACNRLAFRLICQQAREMRLPLLHTPHICPIPIFTTTAISSGGSVRLSTKLQLTMACIMLAFCKIKCTFP